jgi:hypothetical protein
MKKVARYVVIFVASGLVFSTGVFAADLDSGRTPQVPNQIEKAQDVRQRNEGGALKQEKLGEGKQNNSSPYGEEYWKNDPQRRLWEQQDFVQAWVSDC